MPPPLLLKQVDVEPLGLGIVDIERPAAVLLGVVPQLLQHPERAVQLLKEQNVLNLLIELIVLDGAIFDEGVNVLPVTLIGPPLILKEALELVRHLLGDMHLHAAHRAIILQHGTGDVQGRSGQSITPLEQHEKLRDDLFNVLRHKDLVIIELDLPLHGGEVAVDLGEIEDALEVEGIIHVEVDPEERVLPCLEHLAVEGPVLLVCAVRLRP